MNGVWKCEGVARWSPDLTLTLMVALELGRWRVHVAGSWWTFQPLDVVA